MPRTFKAVRCKRYMAERQGVKFPALRQQAANTLILLIALSCSSPQQGVKWSVIGSVTKDMPPASATPSPRVIVHRSDLRLGFEYRQLAASGYFIGT